MIIKPKNRELREARDIFHDLLSRKSKEREWQEFFTKYPYVLSSTLPLRLEPRDIRPLGRPGKSEPDFIFYPSSIQPYPAYGVIEIKRPDSKIIREVRKEIIIPSSDAATAIKQAKVYNANAKYFPKEIINQSLFVGNRSHLFVIMGTSEEIIDKLGSDLLQQQWQSELPSNLNILPYDFVLDCFESRIRPAVHLLVPIRPDEPTMVRIAGGEFLMGSKDSEANSNEKPVHRVKIDAFYMDQYAVSVAEYEKFVNESSHRKPENWDEQLKSRNRPVVYVSWDDAQAYAAWAEKRLPTEAEWEYAARGGLERKKYAWGDESPVGKANYDKDGSRRSYSWEGADKYLEDVRSYEPNGYGLYNMSGNVREWCSDWYDANYYDEFANRLADNPQGPTGGPYRVFRGGGWSSDARDVRAAYRFSYAPVYRYFSVGFRCARVQGR